MALSEELRNEIEGFLSSTAGSVVLERIRELRESNNNLLSVLNGASDSAHPELVVAKAGGVVTGVDRVLLLLEDLKTNDEGE